MTAPPASPSEASEPPLLSCCQTKAERFHEETVGTPALLPKAKTVLASAEVAIDCTAPTSGSGTQPGSTFRVVAMPLLLVYCAAAAVAPPGHETMKAAGGSGVDVAAIVGVPVRVRVGVMDAGEGLLVTVDEAARERELDRDDEAERVKEAECDAVSEGEAERDAVGRRDAEPERESEALPLPLRLRLREAVALPLARGEADREALTLARGLREALALPLARGEIEDEMLRLALELTLREARALALARREAERLRLELGAVGETL